MQLGYFMMPLHAPGKEVSDWLEHDLDQIAHLDGLGYHEAWIGEHYTQPWEPLAAPDLFIAAALQRTSTIRLGTGVSCLPAHHPAQLAARIALLDHMSKGRLNFGVGVSGFNESELWGLDWTTEEHREKFHAVLEGTLELWAGAKPGPRETPYFRYDVPEPQDETSDTGFVIDYHHRPFQQPHPPLAVAAMTPNSSSLHMAGRRGWIPMSINFVPVPALIGSWETYSTGATEAGVTPDRSMWRIARDIFVAESSAEARKQALHGSLAEGWRGQILPGFANLQVPMQAVTGPGVDLDPNDTEGILEYFCDNVWIVGDVDEVTEKINRLYDDVGGFGTLLCMGHEWDDKPAWMSSMSLLKNEVGPQLRGLGD
ncbi:LLM class flavin-dependent oxidoreductase [Gordonia terrae]